MTEPVDSTTDQRPLNREARGWWAYAGPFVLFGLFTMLEGSAPASWYPALYAAKVVAVTASLAFAGTARKDIVPSHRGAAAAILLGVAVFVLWVVVDKWVPYPHLGSRTGFDPFSALPRPAWAAAVFLLVRFFGLVLLVPVMEELFMRSFLLRYFTNPDIRQVPIGTFSMSAFWIVAALSALSHPEWLVAVIASAAYALLLRQTRSLFDAVVAHATTNAALGLYVVLTGDWKYW